jgi:hypothetical protein
MVSQNGGSIVFWYLGQILAQDDDDVRAVRQQIKKAQEIWARVGQVLTAENTPPKVSAKLYKAIMLSVLLYGSKTWNLTTTALARLEGSTFMQPTGWQRNTSQRMDRNTNGCTRCPLTPYRSAVWPPYCTTLTSGGPQSSNTWWVGQSTRRAGKENRGGDRRRNSGGGNRI